jgi:hypothetical protein
VTEVIEAMQVAEVVEVVTVEVTEVAGATCRSGTVPTWGATKLHSPESTLKPTPK